MKIQCDVCQKNVASLFCPADEAALCRDCDLTIHHANKLAGKHKRFSLHHPISKDTTPLCDICLVRRAYLFCQEDRAIVCRECDLCIHAVNEHTKKHNRFFLTGVKIGAYSSLDPTNGLEVRTSSSKKINTPTSFSSENTTCTFDDNNMACDTVSASSISEYLIETIPGYCMEDLFDASLASNDYERNQDQMKGATRVGDTVATRPTKFFSYFSID